MTPMRTITTIGLENAPLKFFFMISAIILGSFLLIVLPIKFFWMYIIIYFLI